MKIFEKCPKSCTPTSAVVSANHKFGKFSFPISTEKRWTKDKQTDKKRIQKNIKIYQKEKKKEKEKQTKGKKEKKTKR